MTSSESTSAARIDGDMVLIDAAAWIEQHTSGEHAEHTAALRDFLATRAHHAASVRAVADWWLSLIQGRYITETVILAIGGEWCTLDPKTHIVLVSHSGDESYAVTWTQSPRSNRPRVFNDGTREFAEWCDWDAFTASCSSHHGFEIRDAEVTTEDGITDALSSLWPNGLFTHVGAHPVHAGHDWHQAYAIHCPVCGDCCRVDMPQR